MGKAYLFDPGSRLDYSEYTHAIHDADGNDMEIVRSATYVIAAADAPAHVKAQADYECDGTADDVEIQAAITALPTGGGLLQLTEGTFNTNTKLVLPGSKAFILQGQGHSTLIKLAANKNDDIMQGTNLGHVAFAYLRLDQNGANQTGGNCCSLTTPDDVIFDHVGFDNAKGCGLISTGGLNLRAVGCSWYGNLGGGFLTKTNAYRTLVLNSHFRNNGKGTGLEGAFRTDGSYHNNIIGCTFYDNCIGVEFYDGSYGIIALNNFYQNERYDVLFTHGGSTENIVALNIMDSASYGSADTYDAISINGTYNSILFNRINGQANRLNVGIREATGADYNEIKGNRIRNALFPIIKLGANSTVKDNVGYVTEKSALAVNVTSAEGFPHGCNTTPTWVTLQPSQINTGAFPATINATHIIPTLYQTNASVAGIAQNVYFACGL